MIISVDHRGLEWLIAVFLSQDPVGIKEICDGVDQHEDNRVRFGLPSRLIAKTFLFRLIYGGSAFSYANDPEFMAVSTSVDFWQDVINKFYAKYLGLAEWHKRLLDDVGRTSIYKALSGRIYHFKPYKTGNGEWKLPRTKILNYPVQGLGADIVMLSRISLWKRLETAKQQWSTKVLTKFVNTVHDDIWLDCPISELKGLDKEGKVCYNICTEVKNVFEDLPANFERCFKTPFNLPCRYELKTLLGEELKI